MKILLVGEYSRLHNSLKEGLLALGHEVSIVGTGDRFKDFPVDYSIAPRYFSAKYLEFPRKIFLRIFKWDLLQSERYFIFKTLQKQFAGYDIVQLINSNALEIEPYRQIEIYKKLFKQNKKNFLVVCGEETVIVDELLKNKLRYSILTPLIRDESLRKFYSFTFKYIRKDYRELYNYVAENVNGIIASDIDYKIPLEHNGIDFSFIPNPINTDKIKFIPNIITDKIIIFLGVNTLSSIKKGTIYFQKALDIIHEKYGTRIEIIRSENLPYEQFISLYNSAHIVLDQCFGYDQGYNALEAMAKGKVVFTGAETEFFEYYKLTERVNINALPDVDSIVDELSLLIENPAEIIAIGRRARNFVEKEHNYIKIARNYIEIWKSK